MIDGKGLLDQLLGAASNRGGAGGGLGDILNSALGGGAAGGGVAGGLPGGLGGGLGGVLGQVTDYAKQNPGLSTAIAGSLGALVLGKSGLKPNALTLGGLAGIGALAYKAYQQYKINNPDTPGPAPTTAPSAGPQLAPPPANSGFAPKDATGGEDAFALSIISAMIAAAKADGTVDDSEKNRILGKLAEGGLTADEQAFFDNELSGPLDINEVVSLAQTPQEGIQIYAASLLAILPAQPAERAYLDMLAARLGIDAALKANIEQTVASAAA